MANKQNFIQCLIDEGRISEVAAERVFDFWCEKRILRVDSLGQYSPVHGAFMNRAQIRWSAKLANRACALRAANGGRMPSRKTLLVLAGHSTGEDAEQLSALAGTR